MSYENVPIAAPYVFDDRRSEEAMERAKSEFCLPVHEDYGWRQWIWFPGFPDANAFAHWWVSEATTALRGDFYPVNEALYDLSKRLEQDQEGLTLRVDMVANTYLALHPDYKATLIPRFGWSDAETSECGARSLEHWDVLLQWWTSIRLTKTSPPFTYLWDFKGYCTRMRYYPGSVKMPDEVKVLTFENEVQFGNRRWDELMGLIPLPLFKVGTYFWEVDGEPFWGSSGAYESALTGRKYGSVFMHDQGRPISEAEFVFFLSFCPSHGVPGLPRHATTDGLLPNYLPPTCTYWFFENGLAAISREEHVRCWPGGGQVAAEDVRSKGAKISEAEFRRHFPKYADQAVT